MNDLPVPVESHKQIFCLDCLTTDRQNIFLLKEDDCIYIETTSIDGGDVKISLEHFLGELIQHKMLGIALTDFTKI